MSRGLTLALRMLIPVLRRPAPYLPRRQRGERSTAGCTTPFPTPCLWQALPSSQPFGVDSQVVDRPTLPDSTRQHLALYLPCCAGSTDHVDTPSTSDRLPHPTS